MIPYTVWSEAGGVGKTSLTVNLARAHRKAGQRVLTVDMDPQDGGLTNHLGLDDYRDDSDADNLALHMIDRPKGSFADLIRTTEGFDVLPSHNQLGNLSELLSKAAALNDELGEGDSFAKEIQLRRVLVDAGVPEEYDVLLIDPPASQGQHLYNSIYATSNLLIPFEPSPKGDQSVHGLEDVVEGIEDTLDIAVGVLGVVPNMVQGTNLNEKYLDELDAHKFETAPVTIGERGAMLGDAWDNQVTVHELADNDDYRDLRPYEEPTVEKFDRLAAFITAQFDVVEANA